MPPSVKPLNRAPYNKALPPKMKNLIRGIYLIGCIQVAFVPELFDLNIGYFFVLNLDLLNAGPKIADRILLSRAKRGDLIEKIPG